MVRILIVESDARLAEVLRARLRVQQFSVQVCASPRQAMAAQKRLRPDLLLLDVESNAESAWCLVEEIRAVDTLPILIISERSGQDDIVAALERGADDYLTKPVPIDELLARIRVSLRRQPRLAHAVEQSVRVGDLEIDVQRQRVLRAGRMIRLTPTEYALVKQFALNLDKLLTERMLRERVWGREHPPSKHTLHVYIARLRRKIEADPLSPVTLVTERGGGYRFASRPRSTALPS